MTGELERIDDGLWIADGPTVSFLGIRFPTRMALVRLGGGGLWIWSPVALDARLEREIAALGGEVCHLVAPNKLHHLWLESWKARWPSARLWAPPGLRRRRRDLAFDGDLGDSPNPSWRDDLDQTVFRGSFAMQEVLFFHRRSRTVLVADLVQRSDPAAAKGWGGILMRLDGMVGHSGRTPWDWRLTFWRRSEARASKARVLAWDPARLVLAHGPSAGLDGRRELEDALRWL